MVLAARKMDNIAASSMANSAAVLRGDIKLRRIRASTESVPSRRYPCTCTYTSDAAWSSSKSGGDGGGKRTAADAGVDVREEEDSPDDAAAAARYCDTSDEMEIPDAVLSIATMLLDPSWAWPAHRC